MLGIIDEIDNCGETTEVDKIDYCRAKVGSCSGMNKGGIQEGGEAMAKVKDVSATAKVVNGKMLSKGGQGKKACIVF